MSAGGLPPALAAVIERALEGQSRGALRDRAKSLSDRYRARGGHALPAEILAYAVTRLPATYAAASSALAALAARAPDFTPQTLLDLGAGPGTASWAALATFPSVHSLLLVEREAEFGPLAAAFAEATAAAATTIAADLDSWLPDPTRQDLVIASYVLGEIAPAARASLIDRAWASAAGALVLIEPGTPDGYGRVIAARDRLLDLGARVVAPCPHHHVCPLPAGDWCHFAVRLPRRRDHRLAKRAEAPFEDEKFSYVAVTRDLGAPAPARLLRAPLVTKPEARLRFCTPAGIEDRIVPARDRAAYKRARKYRWGDEGED